MYQIKNYTVEIDDTSYDVVGKLSDDGDYIVFTVDIDGKEVTLDSKFGYQSKEDFDSHCATMLNGPVFTATLYEWAIKKEWQEEISKFTNGDYWMQYVRHRYTFQEAVPDIINDGPPPPSMSSDIVRAAAVALIVIGTVLLVIA
jgi:hypothetical protein